MRLAEHLEKLLHFQRLSKFKSINEASHQIGISQAGLSKAIRSLEDVLEIQLFHRSREGLTLTKEGSEVLKTAEKILQESTNLEVRLRSLSASQAPKLLRVGMYDSIAVYFYNDLEKFLRRIYPGVRIELTVDSSASLAKLVASENLDLSIGVNLSEAQSSKTEFFRLFDDSYSFYIVNRYQETEENAPLLIHSRATDHNGTSMEESLRSLAKKRRIHRVLNFETLKTLTIQGLGIGVLPTQVAKPLVRSGLLIGTSLPREKQFFGPHTIGFLATKSFLKSHRAFAEDIYRLGEHWSTT